VSSTYRTGNVAAERADPNSLLNWYRALISLRKTVPSLKDGSLTMLDKSNAAVLSHARRAADGSTVVVSLNLSDTERTVTLAEDCPPSADCAARPLLAAGATAASGAGLRVMLAPYGGFVGTVETSSVGPKR
jgi:glycosidase